MVLGPHSPDVSLPRVSRAEALGTFGESNTLVKPADVTNAKDLLALRQKTIQTDEQGDWGRKALDRFEQKRQAERWSAGMAKEDIKAFKDKGTQKEAQRKINQVQKVVATLDILTQEPSEQVKRLKELITAGVIDASATIKSLATDTLTILSSDPSITVQLDGMSDSERITFLQKALVQSAPLNSGASEFLSIVTAKMGEVHTSILALGQQGGQEASVQSQLELAQKTQEVTKKSINDILDRRLVAEGKSKLDVAQRSRLGSILNNPDEASRRQEMAKFIGESMGIAVADVDKAATFTNNKERIATLQREMATLSPQTDKNPAYKTRSEEVTKLTTENGSLGVDDSTASVKTYKEGLRMMSDVEFSTAEKKYQEAHKSGASLALDVKINGGLDIARYQAENDILRQLDSIFGESFFQVVDERTQALREGKQIEAEEAAKKLAVQGEKDKADALIKAAKATKARRIHEVKDGNKITDHVPLKTLNEDIRIASYYGEDGVKLMVARDLGYVTQAQIDGLAAAVPTQIPTELLNKEVMDDPTRKAIFEAICTKEYGKSYRDALMLDYFTAQGYMKEGIMGNAFRGGRGITIDGGFSDRRNFNLQENEWTRLYTNFGDDIQESLMKSQGARELIESLKAQGIVPEGKSKFWIYLLMIVLGIGGIATGYAPVAAAAGLGAVGNAELNKNG